MPHLPDPHVATVLALTIGALALFATSRIRLESAALLVFVTLLVTFAAWPPDGASSFEAPDLFRAFGNEALVAVCALMILGKGVETTRALQPLVAIVSRHWSTHPRTMLLGVMIISAVMSAFLNNTPIVVIMLPALVSIANRNKIAPSKVLLPIGLATIIGGMATTIGTSTNLLVVTLSADIAGLEFGMFDFSWYVVLAGIAGILFLWLAGPRLTPEREQPQETGPGREFVALMRLREDSPLVGKTVADFLRACHYALEVQRVEQGGRHYRVPLPSLELHAGDRLSVTGSRAALMETENVINGELTDLRHAEHRDPETEPKLAELLVTRGSELDGKTIVEADFQSHFGISAVALHRPHATRRGLYQSPKDTTLEEGDIVLCEGSEEQLDKVSANTRVLLLRQTMELPFTQRAPIALAIIASVVLVAAFGLLPISISALGGVGLMLATRCLGWRHVGDALNRQVVLIIVVSLALGNALMITGGDQYLAAVFNTVLADAAPFVVILTLMALSAILTNIVTNNAAAVITTPIAVQIASQLGIDTAPVILAVLFGANLSFVTPIGYQTNLLVFTRGGYRFFDFVRVGLPLALLMWFTLSSLLKWRYAL